MCKANITWLCNRQMKTVLLKQWVQATVSIFFPTFWQLKIKPVLINGSLSMNLRSDRKLKIFKLSLTFFTVCKISFQKRTWSQCIREGSYTLVHAGNSTRYKTNFTSNNQRLWSVFDTVTVIPWRISLADFYLLSIAKINNLKKKVRSWRCRGIYNTITKSKAVFPCGFLFGKLVEVRSIY